MNSKLTLVKTEIYDKLGFEISNFINEQESKEYDACQFKLNGLDILSRSSKSTPKKSGQFVTFWKRSENGPIEPFCETDKIDFYIVNALSEEDFGQFVFPKSILIKKGIISNGKKEGKRAFRVYPSWTKTHNKQAEKTQKWQLNYFYKINSSTDIDKVTNLYKTK